ncbi:MAG: lamin tail domain-containing protein [Verrucomicrobiales bacterium]|nr:lamin tail domain-containing protein [Verrucomicrobiales bacterium]
MYQTPAFVRLYWAALDEALNGFFRTGAGTAVDALLDAKYAAFQANQVPLASPGGIKSWIQQRRGYLQGQLSTVRAAFAVTSGGGQSFDSATSPVVIVGTAPVAVHSLRVNGVELRPTWRTVTTWELRVPLVPGPNALAIAGLDRFGQPVAGAEAELEVTFTGELPPPAVLWINEWMAANVSALPDPADGAFDDWFELYNPGPEAVDLTGWRLTDSLSEPARFLVPPGFDVPPRGHRLLWADAQPEQTRPGKDLHVNFRLGQSGEVIAMFDAYGRLVDAVEYGRQTADRSEGRWPDGAPPPFYPLAAPSPAAPNPVAPEAWPGIRIVQVTALAGGGVRLRWTTDPGRTYAVRFRDSLAGGAWTESPTRVVAEGSTAGWEDTEATGTDGRFYQVILVLP